MKVWSLDERAYKKPKEVKKRGFSLLKNKGRANLYT